MNPVAAQIVGNQTYRYPITEKTTATKPSPKYVEISVDREKTLQNIAFLTHYMEDLKAGRPVKNIHPYMIHKNR